MSEALSQPAFPRAPLFTRRSLPTNQPSPSPPVLAPGPLHFFSLMSGMAARGQGILGIAAILFFLAGAQCSLAAPPSARLVVAGDIACGESTALSATECQQNATAALVATLNPTDGPALRADQYEDGPPHQ